MKENRKQGTLVCPNPIAMSGGTSCGLEAVHGIATESMQFDDHQLSELEKSWNQAFEFGSRVQQALFELHKNLYKYNAILEQSSNKDVYSNEHMMDLVQCRLNGVQDQILDNMRVIAELKSEMIQMRRRSKLNPENGKETDEIRTDMEQWLAANSTFKFLQQLDVIDSCWYISELYKYIQSNDIDVSIAIQDMGKV